MKNILFVYGTLKKGGLNHHYLRGSRFIGDAVTKKRYALYISEFPLVIKDIGVSQIIGEAYEVEWPVLKRVDMLEYHPYLYFRERISIILKASNKLLRAWIYFYPRPEGRLIPSGKFNP